MPEADAIADISPPVRVVCPGVSRSAGRGRSARQSWRSRRETRHRNLNNIEGILGRNPSGSPASRDGYAATGGIIDTERGVHDPNADVPAAERTKRDGRYSRRRGLCDRSSARSWPLPSPNVQLIFITFCHLRTWAHSRLTVPAQAKALLLCEPSVGRTGGEKSLSLVRPFTLAVTGHDQPRPSLTSSRLTSRRRERPHSDTHTHAELAQSPASRDRAPFTQRTVASISKRTAER